MSKSADKFSDETYEKLPGWKKLNLISEEIVANKDKLTYPVDSPKWFDKDANEKAAKKFWSPPFDARFPQTNQTNKCWFYYIDYHRCKNLKGEDFEPCDYLKTVYKNVCPTVWTEKWDTWIEENRFPYNLHR